MTPREKVLAVGKTWGWGLLYEDVRSVEMFRWDGKVRVELHVRFDRAGRIDVWSEWRNVRVGFPDEERGRRVRLEARLEART